MGTTPAPPRPCSSPAIPHITITPAVRMSCSPINQKKPRSLWPYRVMASRIMSALITRASERSPTVNSSDIQRGLSVCMLTGPNHQDPDKRKNREAGDQHARYRPEPLRFGALIGQIGRNRYLNVEVLPLRLLTCGFQSG